MISNEADSKTYVMQTNHNHAQEFAKVAPALIILRRGTTLQQITCREQVATKSEHVQNCAAKM